MQRQAFRSLFYLPALLVRQQSLQLFQQRDPQYKEHAPPPSSPFQPTPAPYAKMSSITNELGEEIQPAYRGKFSFHFPPSFRALRCNQLPLQRKMLASSQGDGFFFLLRASLPAFGPPPNAQITVIVTVSFFRCLGDSDHSGAGQLTGNPTQPSELEPNPRLQRSCMTNLFPPLFLLHPSHHNRQPLRVATEGSPRNVETSL